MAVNKPIEISRHLTKNLKTIFPEDIFYKIWLINKECKNSYIPRKKKNKGQNKFWMAPQFAIFAN